MEKGRLLKEDKSTCDTSSFVALVLNAPQLLQNSMEIEVEDAAAAADGDSETSDLLVGFFDAFFDSLLTTFSFFEDSFTEALRLAGGILSCSRFVSLKIEKN